MSNQADKAFEKADIKKVVMPKPFVAKLEHREDIAIEIVNTKGEPYLFFLTNSKKRNKGPWK